MTFASLFPNNNNKTDRVPETTSASPTPNTTNKEEDSVQTSLGNTCHASCDNSSLESSQSSSEEMPSNNKYVLEVDPTQDDKATRIQLCSFARPHMRAFHCAWWGYFIAFNLWFAASPLLGEIRTSLALSNEQVWTSSIAGVGGTVLMRFLLGPLCDKYGARILYLVVLCAASIPTALLGLVQTSLGLTLTRLCIGFAGGTFVMCQYWCTSMFCKNVVGTANATAAGWGNLGAGVAQLVMGSLLFPLFKWFFAASNDPAEYAWRTVSIVPASIAFASGIIMFYISDDAPQGNFTTLKKTGQKKDVKLAQSFCGGLQNINTWLLFVQYACCFGVEMTMNNAAALYFKDEFGQSTESAAAIASIFGFMNLFARGLGGVASDKANAKCGMRGRLWVHTLVLFLEGSLIMVFSKTNSLASAIVVMALFSLFVQMAEGSSYGIVPYIDPAKVGSISGIVGAGGNAGAVLFSLGFRQLPYKSAFLLMGSVILFSCCLSIVVFIPGHRGLIFSNGIASHEDEHAVVTTTHEDQAADDDDELVMAVPHSKNDLTMCTEESVSIPECDIELTQDDHEDADLEAPTSLSVSAGEGTHHRHAHPPSDHQHVQVGGYSIELSSDYQQDEETSSSMSSSSAPQTHEHNQ